VGTVAKIWVKHNITVHLELQAQGKFFEAVRFWEWDERSPLPTEVLGSLQKNKRTVHLRSIQQH
jgi:hypothetical protein